MTYVGSWKIDDLLTFYVNTQVFATGVATDADAVPAYRVYEDESGTPLLTGNMALLDSANTAGFYSEQITLSAANGFEKGKCYSIYIAATVSSVAGATHRTFQIEAEVDANRLNWANVDNPTTANGLTGTTIATSQVVASVTGAVGSVTGAVGSVTGAVGSVTGNVGGNVNGNVVGSVGSVTGLTPTTIADATLNRDMSAVSDTNARSPLNALRAIRNKSVVAAGVLTVSKEDDTTSAWTAAVTSDATAAPITGVDPT